MELKVCTGCTKEKPADKKHFRPSTTGKNGLNSKCRDCTNAKRNEWRRDKAARTGIAESTEYHSRNRDKINETRAALRKQKRQMYHDLKKRPCLDCGGSFPPVCMDFDHVRGEKVKNLSQMINGDASLKVLMLEIEKCELVCANCHRLRTARRAGWTGTEPWGTL